MTSKSLGTNIIKSCVGKRYWSHPHVRHLSRGGPGAIVGTLQTGYPCAQDLKDQPPWLQICSRCQEALAPPHAPRHRACHLLEEGSGVIICPMAQSAPPARKGLWCRHVPRGTVSTTRMERAPVLPRDPRHRARHPAGEGSRVTTCLVAPGPPPAQGGFGVAAWPRHKEHCLAGLRYRHVSCGSRSASRHVPSGSRPRAYPCVPKTPDPS
jgi:hypothetical protein